MQDNKEMLGKEPIGKLLFKLAVPTVTAQLINMLYNIIDRIYIGHIPEVGELAYTGVGVCLPIIMIVSAFAALICSGGAPRSSIFMGKGDMESAEKTLGGCFFVQIIVSVVLTVILLVFAKPLLYIFAASENTISYAVDYMKIYAIGTIFVEITLGMNLFITAQGYTKTSMFSVLIGAGLNIALDPLFIFAFKMGVKGAALATIISQAASTVWVICFLTGKKAMLKIKFKNFFVSPKLILPCIALGMATFIMQSSESVIMVCFNRSLLKYGGDIAVGAMTTLTSVMQFTLLPLQGLGMGAQPITSYNYGANNPERVKKTFKILLISSLIYSGVFWAMVMAFPKIFAGIFTPGDEMIKFTARALRIYNASLFLFGAQIACQHTFVALGKATSSIVVAVARKFVLLLPLIYIMPAIFTNAKVDAIYGAEPVADFLAVTFTCILFAVQFRKVIKGMEKKKEIETIDEINENQQEQNS